MKPSDCIRNTVRSQNLRRATPILFKATHVAFRFRTPQSEVKKKNVLFNNLNGYAVELTSSLLSNKTSMAIRFYFTN